MRVEAGHASETRERRHYSLPARGATREGVTDRALTASPSLLPAATKKEARGSIVHRTHDPGHYAQNKEGAVAALVWGADRRPIHNDYRERS
jgi:hypothetical protein